MNHAINTRCRQQIKIEDEVVTLGQRVEIYGPNGPADGPPELEEGTLTNWGLGGFNNSKITQGIVTLDQGGHMEFELSYWNEGVYPINTSKI